MNFIIIGLGNFGASLAKGLTALGHDVIGVDVDLNKVEFFKDKIKNTISMDITDIHALKTLPLKDCDMVIVCIGTDFGASIKTSAQLKKLGVQNLVGRESSTIHKTVLNAIGVSETINPEYDTAVMFAEKLVMPGVCSIYNISEEIKITEVRIPEEFLGKRFSEVDLDIMDGLKILALKYPNLKQSTALLEKWIALELDDMKKEDPVFEKEMRFIVMGKQRDIMDFLLV